MPTEEQNVKEVENTTQTEIKTPAKKSGGVLKGCLIAIGIMTLIMTVAGYVAYSRLKYLFENPEVNLARTGMEYVFKSQGFSSEDASYIVEPVMQLESELIKGKVTADDVGKTVKVILNERNTKLALLHVLQEKVLEQSPFSKTQLNNMDKQVSRAVEAIERKHIDVASLKNLAEFVFKNDGEGNFTLRQTLSTQELDELLQLLTQYADSAGIADKTFKFSMKDIFRREIQQAVDQLK